MIIADKLNYGQIQFLEKLFDRLSIIFSRACSTVPPGAHIIITMVEL